MGRVSPHCTVIGPVRGLPTTRHNQVSLSSRMKIGQMYRMHEGSMFVVKETRRGLEAKQARPMGKCSYIG
jgi:hypothetical protein